jgi:hypothetical protein
MWSHGPRHKRIKDVLRGRLFHFIKKRALSLSFFVGLFSEKVKGCYLNAFTMFLILLFYSTHRFLLATRVFLSDFLDQT